MRSYYLFKIRHFFSFYLFTSSSSLTLSSPSFNSIPSFYHVSPSLSFKASCLGANLVSVHFDLFLLFWLPLVSILEIVVKCYLLWRGKQPNCRNCICASGYSLDILWIFSPQSPEKINIVTMHMIGNCKKEKTLCTLIRVGDWFPLAGFQPNWRPHFPPSGHSLMQSSCLFRYGQQPLLEEDIK